MRGMLGCKLAPSKKLLVFDDTKSKQSKTRSKVGSNVWCPVAEFLKDHDYHHLPNLFRTSNIIRREYRPQIIQSLRNLACRLLGPVCQFEGLGEDDLRITVSIECHLQSYPPKVSGYHEGYRVLGGDGPIPDSGSPTLNTSLEVTTEIWGQLSEEGRLEIEGECRLRSVPQEQPQRQEPVSIECYVLACEQMDTDQELDYRGACKGRGW